MTQLELVEANAARRWNPHRTILCVAIKLTVATDHYTVARHVATPTLNCLKSHYSQGRARESCLPSRSKQGSVGLDARFCCDLNTVLE